MKKLLLIVDPQNDFVSSGGSLYVPGSEEAILKIVEYIRRHGDKITDIAITQDTHHKYHIAHPAFWNPRPEPFSQISVEDYRDGVYSAIVYPPRDEKPYDPLIMKYLESLPGPLTIWPEHCIVGSYGWCFPTELVEAVQNWETYTLPVNQAKIYRKGELPGFEAFSLFTELPSIGIRPYAEIDEFTKYDNIVICGFAKDVCVARTVKDMLDSGLYTGKISVLEEGMASIDENSPMNSVFSGLDREAL